jgi:4-amino-4-deoxy-L-arabinose transferase-like glycosyltransferase
MRGRVTAEAAVAGGLAAVFIAISAVWLTLDDRVPDFDNGRHLLRAFEFRDLIADGRPWSPIAIEGDYPPLVHLIGALGSLIGGINVSAPTLAANLVFVPLLAAGLYGAGRAAFGPRAGALAVAFGLATPMVIAQFHVFLVDAPLTALVAVTVWLVLASDRFADRRYALLAGLAVTAGMLTKQTFPLFVAGLLALVLVRGGWRHWRNVALFALVPLVLAGPWYLKQRTRFTESVEGASGAAVEGVTYVTPERWSGDDLGWYLWSFLNVQVLLPLALFFFAGTVWALRRWLREREQRSFAPELAAGLLVSYLAVTFLTLHDSRYTLPMLVYVAVLGSGWIAHLRGRAFALAAGALGMILVANTLAVNLRLGEPARVAVLPDAYDGGVHDRHVTLYSPVGYVVNEPRRDDVLEIMRAARGDGIARVQFDRREPVLGFNPSGLGALARTAGFEDPLVYDPATLGPDGAFFFRRNRAPGDPPPCAIGIEPDGYGIYLTRGDPGAPFPQPNLYCPPR